MKTIVNTLQSLKIAHTLKNKLDELINLETIGFIFYSEKGLLNNSILTLFFHNSDILIKTRQKKWIIESVSRFKVHIHCIYSKDFFKKENVQNTIYSMLNCQRINLVYGATREYKSLLIESFSTDKQAEFENIVNNWMQSNYQRHHSFIKSLKIDFDNRLIDHDIVLLGLKQVVQDTKTKIQIILTLKSDISAQAFINFTFQYCNVVREAFYNDREIYLRDILILFTEGVNQKAENDLEIDNTPINIPYLVELTKKFIKAIYLEMASAIIMNHKSIIKRHKLSSLTKEQNQYLSHYYHKLKQQTKEALSNYEKVESFYLLKQKTTEHLFLNPEIKSGDKLHLLLLASISSLNINEEDNIRQYVSAQTDNKVDVTVILLKKSNWHYHTCMYKSFYDENIQTKNFWLGSPLNTDYTHLETYPFEELKIKFWKECKSMIKPILKRGYYQMKTYQTDADLILYRYAFQQLAIAILFAKMNYITPIYSTKYLWRLLDWYAPELSLYTDCNKDIKELIFEAHTSIRNYPNIKYPTKKCSEKKWIKIHFFIESMYNFSKGCYMINIEKTR